MSDPWKDDPEVLDYAQDVIDELVPMIRDSVLTVSIMPENPEATDVKFAVELGVTMMLDKPILLLVMPGSKVPDHMARVADEIAEYGDVDVLAAKIKAFAEKYGV